jgi:hypothetical protein
MQELVLKGRDGGRHREGLFLGLDLIQELCQLVAAIVPIFIFRPQGGKECREGGPAAFEVLIQDIVKEKIDQLRLAVGLLEAIPERSQFLRDEYGAQIIVAL